jgi:hypothetical protein
LTFKPIFSGKILFRILPPVSGLGVYLINLVFFVFVFANRKFSKACIDDNFNMVKYLIENNADLNPQDNEGWTPVHAAVSVGNIEVVK